MNSVPVIGVAIVNGFHWLQRLVDSVDYPVDNFVIFNNNGKVDFNTHYFLNCIRNELIFETGDINTSARNPAYLKSKNFQLYSLNKKIDNCFKP